MRNPPLFFVAHAAVFAYNVRMKKIAFILAFAAVLFSCADGENDYTGMITNGTVSETHTGNGENTAFFSWNELTNITDGNDSTYHESFYRLNGTRTISSGIILYKITPPHIKHGYNDTHKTKFYKQFSSLQKSFNQGCKNRRNGKNII